MSAESSTSPECVTTTVSVEPLCLVTTLSICLCLSSLLNIKPKSKLSNLIRFSICVPATCFKTSFHCRESFFHSTTHYECSILCSTWSSVISDSSPHARWCQIPQTQANSSLLQAFSVVVLQSYCFLQKNDTCKGTVLCVYCAQQRLECHQCIQKTKVP